MVHWRSRFFSLGKNKGGTKFVDTMRAILQIFTDRKGKNDIPMKLMMILPHLILPRTKAENAGSNAIIQRRLDSLTQCQFLELYNEARAIQVRLPKQKTPKEESDLKSCNKFMCQGKISSALKCLSDHQKGGILSLKEKIGEKTVLDLLKEKHPSPGTLEEDFITDKVDTLPYHDSIFDKINAATIRKAAMRTHGSLGPSGLDADEWRKILTNYGQYSIDLCKTIAQLAQRIAREKLTENYPEAYNACRLIPLDKFQTSAPLELEKFSDGLSADA